MAPGIQGGFPTNQGTGSLKLTHSARSLPSPSLPYFHKQQTDLELPGRKQDQIFVCSKEKNLNGKGTRAHRPVLHLAFFGAINKGQLFEKPRRSLKDRNSHWKKVPTICVLNQMLFNLKETFHVWVRRGHWRTHFCAACWEHSRATGTDRHGRWPPPWRPSHLDACFFCPATGPNWKSDPSMGGRPSSARA